MYEPREDSWLLKKQLESKELEGKKVLEIGAGKGKAGLEAAKREAKVKLADKDQESINYLRESVEHENVVVKQSDLLEAIEGEFDLIMFNPPYIPGPREKESDAVYGGKGGIEVLNDFLEQVNNHLRRSGKALFIFSSRNDLEKLKTKTGFEIVDCQELWFETLYAAETV